MPNPPSPPAPTTQPAPATPPLAELIPLLTPADMWNGGGFYDDSNAKCGCLMWHAMNLPGGSLHIRRLAHPDSLANAMLLELRSVVGADDRDIYAIGDWNDHHSLEEIAIAWNTARDRVIAKLSTQQE